MKRRMNIYLTGLLCFFLVTLVCPGKSNAQSFPDFKLRLTNGKIISSSGFSANKPVIIIVFSPDCGHCKTLVDGIYKKINSFKNAQIVLATFVPEKEIISFEKQYNTAAYPNIIVGSDVPVLFLQKYYKLTNTPFTVLYDKNRKLIASYKTEHAVEDLINQLKKLP